MTRPTIALAIGDPNGIGPEIAVKAAARLGREGGPAIVLVGDEFVVRHYVALCAGDFAVQPFDGAAAAAGRLQLLAVDALPGAAFSPGTPAAAGGRATVDYVAAAIDPATRRLLVRATIDNKDGVFKPEMFANVTIYSGGDHASVGVPKKALIYEGERVRLWVAHDDKSIELRNVQTGLTNGDLVEVRTNLKAGEKIVTKGSLFIDRAASGS